YFLASSLPAASSRRGDLVFKHRIDLSATAIGMLVTLVATLLVAIHLLHVLLTTEQAGNAWQLIRLAIFVPVIGFLIYGNVVYQICRFGHLRRSARHLPASHNDLHAFAAQDEPAPATVLVPSYQEQPGVVRQTLISAALQDYPHRRVVLLLDDT